MVSVYYLIPFIAMIIFLMIRIYLIGNIPVKEYFNQTIRQVWEKMETTIDNRNYSVNESSIE